MGRLKELLAAARARRPALDHVVQMLGRYSGGNGSTLVSSITVPGFLAIFPLIALALSVAGFVARYDSGAQRQISTAIEGYFPGLGLGSLVSSIAENAVATGVIGLVGLLASGLGLVSALRSALRMLWRLPKSGDNIVVARLKDAGVLIALGLTFVLSLAVGNVATTATTVVVRHVPALDGGALEVVVRVLAVVVAVGVNLLLFLAAFRLLPQAGTSSVRDYLSGAMFAAVGFEVLQLFGSFYITRTTGNPLYGSIAIAVGLLVWVNLLAQVFVLAAAWVVTAPYSPDTPPSGTASGPDGVPAVALPTGELLTAAPSPALSATQRRLAAGAGTAAFGAVAGTAVVLAVGFVRAMVPRRPRQHRRGGR